MSTRETWLAALRAVLERRHAERLLRELHPLESGTGPKSASKALRIYNSARITIWDSPATPRLSPPPAPPRNAGAPAAAPRGSSPDRWNSITTWKRNSPASNVPRRALVFPTGYMANLAVLTTFAGQADAIVSDKLNHASLLDGRSLSRHPLPHLSPPPLPAGGGFVGQEPADGGRFLVTEHRVFDRWGRRRPAGGVRRRPGGRSGLVVVDEAHATGVSARAAPVGRLRRRGSDRPLRGHALQGPRMARRFRPPAPRGHRHPDQRRPELHLHHGIAPGLSGAALAALRIVQREPARRQRSAPWPTTPARTSGPGLRLRGFHDAHRARHPRRSRPGRSRLARPRQPGCMSRPSAPPPCRRTPPVCVLSLWPPTPTAGGRLLEALRDPAGLTAP